MKNLTVSSGDTPNDQCVNYKYKGGLLTYLTSGQSMIWASLDGRGTRGRGGTFKHELYKNFGQVDVEDQISAIE